MRRLGEKSLAQARSRLGCLASLPKNENATAHDFTVKDPLIVTGVVSMKMHLGELL